jgi:8-oxo-dGTP diphosphatase
MIRLRACAAIIRNGKILMVLHRSSTREYWTLPGGGIENNEIPEQTIVREVKEETGLDVKAGKLLFLEPPEEYCFSAELMASSNPVLGYDPEESDLPKASQLLQDVAWLDLKEMREDKQISKVISPLGIEL